MMDLRSHGSPANVDALWLVTLRRYFAFAIPAHLTWEFAQLPLYAMWYTESPASIVFAAIHCTGGDALILAAALLGALLLFGDRHWPHERYTTVAAAAVIAGVAYTIFSEWHNTEVRKSWAYSSFMPTLPAIGTGLSPFLQWLVIPVAAFWWAQRSHAPRVWPVGESR